MDLMSILFDYRFSLIDLIIFTVMVMFSTYVIYVNVIERKKLKQEAKEGSSNQKKFKFITLKDKESI